MEARARISGRGSSKRCCQNWGLELPWVSFDCFWADLKKGLVGMGELDQALGVFYLATMAFISAIEIGDSVSVARDISEYRCLRVWSSRLSRISRYHSF